MLTSLLFALAFPLTSIAQQVEPVTHGDTNDWCLRCHGMETLGVRNPDGTIRNLSVDGHAFAGSNHRRLNCVDCHSDATTQYPHADDPKPASTCVDCHTRTDHPLVKDNPLAAMHFSEIEQEYNLSIHYRKLAGAFTCFACHNPHRFRKSEDPSLATIEAQNGVCLSCHGSEERFIALTERPRPDLGVAHAWLPNRALHWEHVRCLDCHTSYDPPNRSHLILAARTAVQKCEDCHSANSVLLDKLYRYRRAEETERGGFINAALFNDSYVVGATRNSVLDLVGIVVIGGALLGVIGHGALRIIGRKRGRRHD